MKRILFQFKYPKILALLVAIAAAYIFFTNPAVKIFVSSLGRLESFSYLGIFIAGIFFSYGFTSPFAAGFFITLNPQNIYIAAVIGGLGAMLSDLLIFRIIRTSFKDEFEKLKKEKISRKIDKFINKTLGKKIRTCLMYTLAGIFIASPLPDEAGVIILAGMTKIKACILAMISFALNSLGILVLLYL